MGERLKRTWIFVLLALFGVISWIGVVSGMGNFKVHARAVSSGVVEMKVDFLGFKGVVAEFHASLNPTFGGGSIEVEPMYLQLTASDESGDYLGGQIVNFRMEDPRSFIVAITGGYGVTLKRRLKSVKGGVETVRFTGILRMKLKTGRFPVEVVYPVSARCEVEL